MARVLEGLRLSELARCPRQCALRGRGAIPAEPTDQAKRWMSRGQLFGMYARLQFEERYGKDGVQAEREIPWGDGWTGHADLYIPSEKLIVEVVSSASPDGIIAAKIKQAKLYLHFDNEAENAAVFVINPSNLDREDLFPVILTTDDVEEIEREVEEIRASLAGADLPACCASSPSECRNSYLCSFTEDAWDGWVPPQAGEIDLEPEMLDLLRRWTELKSQERALAKTLETLEGERKDIQGMLAGAVPEGNNLCGAFKVRRSVVKGRETFQFSRARKAGVIDGPLLELLSPFMNVGKPFERWEVTVEGDIPVNSADFGDDVPF